MDNIDLIIAKSLTGEASGEEIEQLQKWLSKDPRNEEIYQNLHMVWHSERQTNPAEIENAFEKLQQRILTGQPAEANTETTAISRRMKWWHVAAAVLLLISIGTFFLYPNNSLTVSTSYSERISVDLPDGSTVQLNANSDLKYSKNWTESEDRQVWLEGEAFFTVATKETTDQKFVVITDDLKIEVLGTVFNVNNRRNETSVYLQEGKVRLKLGGSEDEVLMVPGDLVTYSEKQNQISTEQVEQPELHISWKDGVFEFEDTPLVQVFDKLEAYYGISIHYNPNEVEGETITAGIPIQDLETAVRILEPATRFEFVLNGDKLTIK